MKIVGKILIVVIFLILISYTLKYYSSVSYMQKKYLNINSNEVGKVNFKYLSPNSFNGDGISIDISYTGQDKNFKFPNSGFYILYDKQNDNYTTSEEYFNYSSYRTFNYILAILDFQNNAFVYFEEDT